MAVCFLPALCNKWDPLIVWRGLTAAFCGISHYRVVAFCCCTAKKHNEVSEAEMKVLWTYFWNLCLVVNCVRRGSTGHQGFSFEHFPLALPHCAVRADANHKHLCGPLSAQLIIVPHCGKRWWHEGKQRSAPTLGYYSLCLTSYININPEELEGV